MIQIISDDAKWGIVCALLVLLLGFWIADARAKQKARRDIAQQEIDRVAEYNVTFRNAFRECVIDLNKREKMPRKVMGKYRNAHLISCAIFEEELPLDRRPDFRFSVDHYKECCDQAQDGMLAEFGKIYGMPHPPFIDNTDNILSAIDALLEFAQ